MIDPRKCAQKLLDDSLTIDVKTQTLAEYFDWHSRFGTRMKTGVHFSRNLALQQLCEAAQSAYAEGQQRLNCVIKEIMAFADAQKKTREGADKDNCRKLKLLAPGTPIVIARENREEIVFFLEVKRTRFACEFSDGRQFSMPVSSFVQEFVGEMPERLSADERACRDLIRALAGSNSKAAAKEIMRRDDAIQTLIDEMAAVLSRIEHAPVGISRGLLASALGAARIVNPKDWHLERRIPEVLKAISERGNRKRVLSLVKKCPNLEVRERLLRVIK